MTVSRTESNARSLRLLFGGGTLVGLTDGQLLERFARGHADIAEAAFAILVDRHGALVLRACRGILGNSHDAEDAFQTTFLTLARRGGSLWIRDSVAPWLHRVACRAAMNVRRAAARRRRAERDATIRPEATTIDIESTELARLIHEEIDRLPAHFRLPVILCELEGHSYEEAARHIGCPVGTVKSRLARGRNRLAARLRRRGITRGSAALGLALAEPFFTDMPEALAARVVRAAAATATAAKNVGLKIFVLAGAMVAVAALGFAALVALREPASLVSMVAGPLGAVGPEAGKPAQESRPEKAATARSGGDQPAAAASDPAQPTRAWHQKAPYQPPDFERFFPDDPAAGPPLDALIKNFEKDPRSDVEKLRLFRQGFRRAETNRATMLTVVGNRYIWGKSPQHPDAIEIVYHAADWKAGGDNPNDSFMHAIHNGLSVVEPKSPAILKTFAEICMHKDDPNAMSRIAWGSSRQRDELIEYLKPYYRADDEKTRQRALEMRKIFGGERDAFEWYTDKLREQARANFSDKLPAIKQALAQGNGAARLEALELIARERLDLIMDNSFIAALGLCATDADPIVRQNVAQVAGEFWIWRANPQTPEAIALALRLARDSDLATRRDAVYYGLSTVGNKPHEVVRAMLECAITDRLSVGRVAWGLKGDATALAMLDEMIRGDDLVRAEFARAMSRSIAHGDEPLQEHNGEELAGSFSQSFDELFKHLEHVYPNFKLKGIDWAAVGQELRPRAALARTPRDFGLLVLELIAKLEDSHATVIAGRADPPRPELPEWEPGLYCLIDDRGLPVVYAVSPGSSAAKAGIAPGSAIVSVNSVSAQVLMREWIERTRRYYGYSSERNLKYDAARLFLSQATRNQQLLIKTLDPQGREESVILLADGNARRAPRLPVKRPGISENADISWGPLSDRLGYIAIRRIRAGLEPTLDRAIADLGDLKGLVLDLRGNSGGGFDVNTAFVNFEATDRKSAGAARPRYQGPIALLIDERTISAGEGWASWFVANKRAKLFGATSAGASCRKEIYTLTNGLYRVVVPVKAYTGFLDRPIERRGIEPDFAVGYRAKDLAEGRDTIVEAALTWLKTGAR